MERVTSRPYLSGAAVGEKFDRRSAVQPPVGGQAAPARLAIIRAARPAKPTTSPADHARAPARAATWDMPDAEPVDNLGAAVLGLAAADISHPLLIGWVQTPNATIGGRRPRMPGGNTRASSRTSRDSPSATTSESHTSSGRSHVVVQVR